MSERTVPLTRGHVAVVDAEDYARVMEAGPWRALPDGCTVYAVRRICGENGRPTSERLHRFLLGAPKGTQVDHVDRNGLNNTRRNLRLATSQENARNRGVRSDNASGLKGVTYHGRSRMWQARIRVNGRSLSLGYFRTPEDAAHAYDVAAAEHFGEFSCGNTLRA